MGVPLYLPNAALVGEREAKREMRSEVMQSSQSHSVYTVCEGGEEVHRGREELRYDDVRTHNQPALIYRAIKGKIVQLNLLSLANAHTEMLIPELIVLNR